MILLCYIYLTYYRNINFVEYLFFLLILNFNQTDKYKYKS